MTTWFLVSAAAAADLAVPADYATLTQAVMKAQPGDRIVIAGQAFSEDVVLDGISSLEIVGAGPTTVIRGVAGSEVIRLQDCTDVVLRDLAVDAQGSRQAW